MVKAEKTEAAVHRRSSKCSLKFRNVHSKTPVLESFFDKVADVKA